MNTCGTCKKWVFRVQAAGESWGECSDPLVVTQMKISCVRCDIDARSRGEIATYATVQVAEKFCCTQHSDNARQ